MAISSGLVFGFIPKRSENYSRRTLEQTLDKPTAILKPVSKSIDMLFALAFGGIARRASIMVKLCEGQFGLSLKTMLKESHQFGHDMKKAEERCDKIC